MVLREALADRGPGFVLAAEGLPPRDLAVAQQRGLPHRLLDARRPDVAAHAHLHHGRVALLGIGLHLEAQPAEELRDVRPPRAHALMAVVGLALGLRDERPELDVFARALDERAEVAPVDR